MRTEDDLRAALATLEAQAPDAGTVLDSIRGRDGRLGRAAFRPIPGGRVTLRRWRTPGLVAAGAVTAAAALFVAMVSAGGGDRPPVISGGQPPSAFRLPAGAAGISGGVVKPARLVLLAAAVKAAQAPPTSGRYWKTTSVDGNFRLVGPDNDPYVILERVRDETWIKPPRGAGAEFVQSLGVQLGSAADRPAWLWRQRVDRRRLPVRHAQHVETAAPCPAR